MALQKLYKEEKVSPFSGCLPILIQMPFLISIFYALREYPYDEAYKSFLWMLPWRCRSYVYSAYSFSAISTFAIQKQMSGAQVAMNEAPGKTAENHADCHAFVHWLDQHQFPPSGLVIYWVVSNVFQWLQQIIMFRGKKKGAANA